MNTDIIIGILFSIFHVGVAVDVYRRVGLRRPTTLFGWVGRAVMVSGVTGLILGLVNAHVLPLTRHLSPLQVLPPALIVIGVTQTLWSTRTSTILTYITEAMLVFLGIVTTFELISEADTIILGIGLRAFAALVAAAQVGFVALQTMRVPSGRARLAPYLAVIAACSLLVIPVVPSVVPSFLTDVLATSLLWFSVRRAAAQNA